ncbi:MAG: BREX-1 system adenine-specific DNA-methyltransferase PglX [Bacteroidales bacterium]|nr:BREX-1 system adenine-specific DNA-methyltransferase PglX [Bacteroidales bacterium]
MDTNNLKRFAQATRIRLLEAVQDKLEYVLNHDTVDLRDYAASVHTLKKDVERIGKEALIDKVAYTWFNRLMALRFMDANGYQPLRLMVISPKERFTQPEILDEAMRGHIPEELRVDRARINDLLDGRITSPNPQNEVYRMLLVASCNYLHSLFPFLFEQLNDYTELLLPDDLISELSIIYDFVEGMTQADCQEVEVMGWLYQFYISELNSELISAKRAYKKNEIAPASQLFTPKWIVQYMVDNTLGQVWSEINPRTTILKNLEFYIKPQYKVVREGKPIEEIKFFEPCVGSGHVLAYAFDLFYMMYEEAGYALSEIPYLILKHNLFGVDIDPRAAQIASFTLLMKARQKHRRFFRKAQQENLVPNIYHYEDFEEDDKFNNATVLGSLIRVTSEETETLKVKKDTLFGEGQQKLKELYQLLSRKYDVVVTNPPYINSSRMEPSLKKYVNKHYKDTKSDLFASFILRCLELTNQDGLVGNMTPFVWMFITSYQKLREIIIEEHFINNLIQLEYSGFDGATVPICTFTLRNKPMSAEGSYIRLSDFRGSHNQAPKTLEAIQNPDCGWFYVKNQKKFKKIPGWNIGYWLSDNALNSFENYHKLNELFEARKGLATSDNNRFLRFWFEVDKACSSLDFQEIIKNKWFKYNKGGSFRKWYGNFEYVINWYNDGYEIKNFRNPDGALRSRPQNLQYNFKESLTWSKITSGSFSSRIFTKGGLVDDAAAICYRRNNEYYIEILGLLNTKVVQHLLKALNPTLNIQIGDIGKLPISINVIKTNYVEECIKISTIEWNSRETSWDFLQNELIRLNGQDVKEAVELYKLYWTKQFYQLHHNEERLNKEFIHIYGLEEELTPDVALEDITLLRDELNQRELKELLANYHSGWQLNEEGKWELATRADYPELPFDEKELVMQLISYAVGCMFGRYSIDKEGLILANQGDGTQEYYAQLGDKEQLRFVLDEDEVIPVLDEEWFEDDIVVQFRRFVRVVWGKENVQRNMEYMERVLGKPLRNYFHRDFYNDHIKRYKKRPIYWMVASPGGEFQALIYLHRYNVDTLSHVLNDYLRPYTAKLENRIDYLSQIAEEGVAREKTRAMKEMARLEKIIDELRAFDRTVLYPLATERISIDLDDGVLVNYNILGSALKLVSGLNDAATKKRVRGFDWIDVEQIR